MESGRVNKDYEKELLEEYTQEATSLVQGWFNKNKTKKFTQTYIKKQLNTPLFPSTTLSSEACSRLKPMGALEVQDMLLSDPKQSLERVVDSYHSMKKAELNKRNHLTWSFYEEPVSRARDLDQQVASMAPDEVREKLPLYGFVLSVKDSIYVKDSPSTCGIFINLDRVASEDPQTIRMLKDAGAVITSKGNIPQFLFSMESVNSMYGASQNPFDPERSSGGSSGGDAALVAMGMVNAAIGSDGAGSLRIPALFCGICALKPTPYRLSMLCHSKYLSRYYGSEKNPQRYFTKGDSQYIALPTIGPLARTPADLSRLLRVMYSDQSFDNTIPPMPWNDEVEFKKRVGVIRALNFMEPSAAASRALEEAVERLRERGYEVVEMDEVQGLMDQILFWTIVVFQKNRALLNCVRGQVKFGEPVEPLYKFVGQLHNLPRFMVRLLRWREGNSRRGMFYDTYFKSLENNQISLQLKLGEFYNLLEKKMSALGVSGLVTVGLPVAPIRHYDSDICQSMAAYLFIFNGLNMPAGVCPVTRVREDEQVYESRHQDYITDKLKEIMAGSQGLPMGVQVVARAYCDEIVVKIMEDIKR